MPDPTEPTVPAGSGDADFDAALAQAAGDPAPEPAEPVADPTPEPEPAAEPVADPDFTFATLENGQREMKLASGETFRGKDDAELLQKLGQAKLEATRHIQTLNGKLNATPVPSTPSPVATPDAVDPTALAIADLMAPAFGAKNGAELVAAFAEQQRTAAAQQEFMAVQQANMEAANFFRAVPEFSKSPADADKIDQFLQANNMPFNAASAEMAYYTLKAKGEMTAAPVATRTPTPKNNMPPPPAGTAPANTGKGAPNEADLYAMSTEQLEALIAQMTPQ